MEIKHQDNAHNGIFFIELNGEIIARMTYLWDGDKKIIIEHTIVDESLKGQGVGKKLVLEGVAFARNKGLKIHPVCSFAKKVLENNPEFLDVL